MQKKSHKTRNGNQKEKNKIQFKENSPNLLIMIINGNKLIFRKRETETELNLKRYEKKILLTVST